MGERAGLPGGGAYPCLLKGGARIESHMEHVPLILPYTIWTPVVMHGQCLHDFNRSSSAKSWIVAGSVDCAAAHSGQGVHLEHQTIVHDKLQPASCSPECTIDC
jgi:hypothetical protein